MSTQLSLILFYISLGFVGISLFFLSRYIFKELRTLKKRNNKKGKKLLE